MHIEIARNKAILTNPEASAERKAAALSALKSIAADPSDNRSLDSALVLREVAGDDVCTDNGQEGQRPDALAKANPVDIPGSYEFKVSSAYVRTCILLGMADEDAAKAGQEPFAYENDEVRATVGCWYEGWKRAKTLPEFWDLFNRILSPNCKTLLGFNEVLRPSETVAA